MYYRLKYGKYYIIKIIILVLVAVLGELFIWWAMVREESVDWLAGQIMHNPWPYAVTQIEDGRTIIGNVIIGFEVTLPAGWQVERLKYPNFYFSRDNELICEIKSDIIKSEEKIEIMELLSQEDNFIRTYVSGLPAIKKEQTTSQGNFIYELQIPIGQDVITYTLFADKDNKYECRQNFEKIRRSFLYY